MKNYDIRPIGVIPSGLMAIVLLCLVIGCAGRNQVPPRTHMPLSTSLNSQHPETAAKRKQIVGHAIKSIGTPYQ